MSSFGSEITNSGHLDRLPASLSVLVIIVLNLLAWFFIIGIGWLLLSF
jgi:hypothetical protein